MIRMDRKRLIITSLISIVLISSLYINKTYSVYTTESPDEEINIYKTGNLDIEVIGNNKPIENILPTSIEESDKLPPYRLIVTNKGTVSYKFNIILEETTSSNKIDNKYIMTKVGKFEPKPLSECENNILKKDIIIEPNESANIDVRVWITDKVPNTEMKKSFFSKIKVEGIATKKSSNIDNDKLTNPIPEEKTEELTTQDTQSDNQTEEE